jgi:hypothetical protein
MFFHYFPAVPNSLGTHVDKFHEINTYGTKRTIVDLPHQILALPPFHVCRVASMLEQSLVVQANYVTVPRL